MSTCDCIVSCGVTEHTWRLPNYRPGRRSRCHCSEPCSLSLEAMNELPSASKKPWYWDLSALRLHAWWQMHTSRTASLLMPAERVRYVFIVHTRCQVKAWKHIVCYLHFAICVKCVSLAVREEGRYRLIVRRTHFSFHCCFDRLRYPSTQTASVCCAGLAKSAIARARRPRCRLKRRRDVLLAVVICKRR